MEILEEYTQRLLDLLAPLLYRFPPSHYVAILLGVMNTCIFYLRFGSGLLLFVPYLVIGSGASMLGVTVGQQMPSSWPTIGDVNVVAATVSTWIVLFIARSLRLW